MGKYNRLLDFTVALCLLCGLTGVLGYNGNLTKPSPYVAYCNYGPQFHEGLFPTLIPTSPVEENCQKFTHCRPSKFRNRTDGYEFKCSDWDPDKKYFDAKTCKCVSTSDHCSENVNYNYNRKFPLGSKVRELPQICAELSHFEQLSATGIMCRAHRQKLAGILARLDNTICNTSRTWTTRPSIGNVRMTILKGPQSRGRPTPIEWTARKGSCGILASALVTIPRTREMMTFGISMHILWVCQNNCKNMPKICRILSNLLIFFYFCRQSHLCGTGEWNKARRKLHGPGR